MPLVLNGTTGVQDNSGAFVQGTSVASTSGTSIDFTSIPSWVKRVTVMFNGVSTNGSSVLLMQAGTSSGIVNTGYSSVGTGFGNSIASANYTTGFGLQDANAASYAYFGNLILNNQSGNVWTLSGNMVRSTANSFGCMAQGAITLSGTLDRIRITTVNGTDAFDAGSINITWE